MKRVVVFIVLAMVVISSVAAQNVQNEAQRIVGTWVTGTGSYTITVVFNANGTGTANGENFFWGISITGIVYIAGEGEAQLFLSPDGRRMILNDDVYQKR